jgi:hypothetical protein
MTLSSHMRDGCDKCSTPASDDLDEVKGAERMASTVRLRACACVCARPSGDVTDPENACMPVATAL